MGSFRQDEISVWNDSTQWTPTAIDGKILIFNLQSNGQFLIFDNSRRLIFDFRNDMSLDFSIGRVLYWRERDEEVTRVAERTYLQYKISTSANYRRALTVESLGTSLEDLEVRIVSGAIGEIIREGTSIHFNWTQEASSEAVSIYVGNVLVAYFPRQ